MTVEALLMEWIPDGALPMYAFGELERYYTYREGRWDLTPTFRDGRAWISIEVDMFFDEFQARIRDLIRSLDDLVGAVAGTLLFVIRTLTELEPHGRLVLAGMAFAPFAVEGETALIGADPADLLIEFCGGIVGADSNALHPAIRAAYERELHFRALAEVRRREWAATEVERAEAEARSLVLLEEHLTPEQLAEFHTTGVFHVELRDGRRFRFSKKFGHNVHLLEGNLCVTEYCIISVERIPLYDQILAQKVLLEVLPEEFFRIANFRHLPQPTAYPRPPVGAEFANMLAQARHV